MTTIACAGKKSGEFASEQPASHEPGKVRQLSGTEQCDECTGWLLPGSIQNDPEIAYDIHSDLPEKFEGYGVLYTTEYVLPKFTTLDGTDVPLEMRTQVQNGFETIDDSFEVFLFHIAQPGDGTQARRIVIHVRNRGEENVLIRPRQIIKTEGTIGTVHEFESTLGKRVMEGDWETRFESISIEPGDSKVIAYSKQFAAAESSADKSTNINCFGRVQAFVESEAGGPGADLVVSVVAIPGNDDLNMMDSLTIGLIEQGAHSLEQWIDFLTEPSDCQLRRASGVAPGFFWESKDVEISLSEMPADGYKFQMILPEIQSRGCDEARQTANMLLHPPYTRPDTIGNYMIPYWTDLRLTNDTDSAKSVDLQFGKESADIGLAWQIMHSAPTPPEGDARRAWQQAQTSGDIMREQVEEQPVHTDWAGPKQDTLTASFLTPIGGPITLQAGKSARLMLKYMVLGNSSLPYQIFLSAE